MPVQIKRSVKLLCSHMGMCLELAAIKKAWRPSGEQMHSCTDPSKTRLPRKDQFYLFMDIGKVESSAKVFLHYLFFWE